MCMRKLIKPYQEDAMFHYVVKKALKKYKAFPFSQNVYEKLTMDCNGKTYGDMLRDDYTSGYCYFYATLLCKALPDSILRLGVLNTLNTDHEYYYSEFGHAWVEFNNFVYDTSSKMIFNKDFYYQNYDASVKETYTHIDLENPDIFFKLAVNAVKDREEKIDFMFKMLPYGYSPSNDIIEESIKKVNSESVLNHIQKDLNDLDEQIYAQKKQQ